MTQPTPEQLEATHYCVVCAARWRRHDDGTWSLVSKECGPCCDNAPMGDQIIARNKDGTLDGEAFETARQKVLRKNRQDEIARYGGIECQLCGAPFELHGVDWSCRERVRPRFKFPPAIEATEARMADAVEAERERCIMVAPCTAQDPNTNEYDRGYFDAVMEYQKAIRSQSNDPTNG